MKINCSLPIRVGAFLASALFISNTSQGTLITGLNNTGVDDSGNVLPLHSVEQHYVVSGPSEVDEAYVAPIVLSSAFLLLPLGLEGVRRFKNRKATA
ncbi:MAG TPA: hypothetical protein VNT26_20430 [Candidatus Sulfotelmatobacter sp.]|nr:hypothetical protein [Candidatus Sulfotelmatobacter sp.]